MKKTFYDLLLGITVLNIPVVWTHHFHTLFKWGYTALAVCVLILTCINQWNIFYKRYRTVWIIQKIEYIFVWVIPKKFKQKIRNKTGKE